MLTVQVMRINWQIYITLSNKTSFFYCIFMVNEIITIVCWTNDKLMYLYVYENEWPNFSFSSTPLHKFCNNLLLFRLFYRNQLQMKKNVERMFTMKWESNKKVIECLRSSFSVICGLHLWFKILVNALP